MEKQNKHKSLEEALKEFKEKIDEGRKSDLILHLDDYEEFIAGNISRGDYCKAKYHIELLLTYYLGNNPFCRLPNQEKKMEEIRETEPTMYRMMDASKKMYEVGIAAKSLLRFI